MKKPFRFLDNFLIREKLLTIIGSFLLVNLALAATDITDKNGLTSTPIVTDINVVADIGDGSSLTSVTPATAITETKDIRVRTQEGTENHINYFRLILQTPPSVDATIEYQTRDGSATAGQDYVATSGTATIRAGETETLIGVGIIADTEIEGDETFDLVITNPKNGKFAGGALEIVQTHTIAGVGNTTPTDDTEITDKFITSENPIADQYIVVLKDNFAEITNKLNITTVTTSTASTPVNDFAQFIATKYNATIKDIYEDSIQGFSINVAEEKAKQIATEIAVTYIMEDAEITLDDVIQTNNISESVTTTASMPLKRVYPNPPWGLDRIDQCALPLNNAYTTESNTGGKGVHAYVIDTGINEFHPDFTTTFGNGFNVIPDNNGTNDCHGHGTHVAGIIGSQTSGVAKNSILHPVRVLDCNGRGRISGVIYAIDWVARTHISPAVANISFATSRAIPPIDAAIRAAIGNGVTFVVAAGNNYGTSACNYSPARTREAITVGATDNNDNRSPFSNTGSCIDVFAPGSDSASTWIGGSYNTISSTGMSAAHVTGIAALYLEENITATPAMVTSAIMSQSIVDVINNVGTGSPNLLAHSLKTERKPFFRYYNTFHGAHLYTTDWNELNAAGIGSWNYESTEGYLTDYIAGVTTPLYRYHAEPHSNFKEYYYTSDWFELGYGRFNFHYEGIAGYVPIQVDTDTTNFYRYLNSGHHFFTTNFNELGNGQNGWSYKGVKDQVYSKRICKAINTGCNTLTIDTNNEDIGVHDSTVGLQVRSQVTYLDDGGWIIKWDDFTEGKTYKQQYDVCGVRVGNNVVVGDDVLLHKNMVTLSDGSYAIILPNSIKIYNINGGIQSTISNILPSVSNGYSAIAAFRKGNSNSGNFIVTAEADNKMQIYSNTGQTIGSEITYPSQVSSGYSSRISAIATLEDGGWIVIENTNSNQAVSGEVSGEVYMTRYNQTGSIVEQTATRIDTVNSNNHGWYPSTVLGLKNGGWLVVIIPHRGGGLTDAELHHYDKKGLLVKKQSIAKHYFAPVEPRFSMAELSNGDWLIAWESSGIAPNYIAGAYMQRFNGSTGNPIGQEIRANKFLTNHDFPVSVTALLDGGWIATWDAFDLGGGTEYDVFMKRYNSQGDVVH